MYGLGGNRDLVNASMKNLGKAPGGEYRSPPLVSAGILRWPDRFGNHT